MMFCGISVEALTELVQKILCKNWLQLELQYKNMCHINGSTSPWQLIWFIIKNDGSEIKLDSW